MSTFMIIIIVVSSIALYLILYFVFLELTGPNDPLWFDIYCFPLTFLLYPILYIRAKREDERIRKWVEEYNKEKAKASQNRGE